MQSMSFIWIGVFIGSKIGSLILGFWCHAAPTPRYAIDLQGRDSSMVRVVSTAHGSGGMPAASS
jgi:hypothetical protein